jgi:hypothetical protein
LKEKHISIATFYRWSSNTESLGLGLSFILLPYSSMSD